MPRAIAGALCRRRFQQGEAPKQCLPKLNVEVFEVEVENLLEVFIYIYYCFICMNIYV